jgi:hypothetical protein
MLNLSLTLKKEHKPKVFEEEVLRRTLGSEEEKIIETCRNVYKEIHNP